MCSAEFDSIDRVVYVDVACAGDTVGTRHLNGLRAAATDAAVGPRDEVRPEEGTVRNTPG